MPLEDLEEGLHELAVAEDDYLLAEHYYMGTNQEHFASTRMRRALRAYESRYRIRLAKIPVDAVADRLEIAAVSVNPLETEKDDDPLDPTKEDKLTQILQDEIRDWNDMDVGESEAMLKACEFGDSFVIVDQDEEDRVRLFCNSPFECRIIYDHSGYMKRFAIKVWEDRDDQDQRFMRATLFYADAVEQYATKPGRDGGDIVDWVPYGDGTPYFDDELGQEISEDGVHLYPFGQIPVFHFRTARPYGVPEHEAAYGPQDMIDKLTISQMATTDFMVFPQRYFLEDPNFESEGETDWSEDDEDAETVSAPTPKLNASPGEVWFMTGMKTAGQFNAADPDAFLKPLQFLGKSMAATSNTPFPLFDDDSTSSGEDRRVKEAGQTRKVKKRQKQFGATWREVYAYCLSLITGDPFEDLIERIEVRWVPAESIDPAEAWELAGKKKGVGLPLVQILTEHGYSADTIDKMMKMALAEREEQIALQQKAFASTHQENRDDRRDQANPGNVDVETGGTTAPAK